MVSGIFFGTHESGSVVKNCRRIGETGTSTPSNRTYLTRPRPGGVHEPVALPPLAAGNKGKTTPRNHRNRGHLAPAAQLRAATSSERSIPRHQRRRRRHPVFPAKRRPHQIVRDDPRQDPRRFLRRDHLHRRPQRPLHHRRLPEANQILLRVQQEQIPVLREIRVHPGPLAKVPDLLHRIPRQRDVRRRGELQPHPAGGLGGRTGPQSVLPLEDHHPADLPLRQVRGDRGAHHPAADDGYLGKPFPAHHAPPPGIS